MGHSCLDKYEYARHKAWTLSRSVGFVSLVSWLFVAVGLGGIVFVGPGVLDGTAVSVGTNVSVGGIPVSIGEDVKEGWTVGCTNRSDGPQDIKTMHKPRILVNWGL
jgi:hypothetical protein